MLTLVELRKYENRKKSKAGAFLPRRVPKEGDNSRQIAPPRLWKRATAKPPVPKGNALIAAKAPRVPPKQPPPGAVFAGGAPLAPPPPPPPPKVPNFSTAALGMAFQEPGPPTPSQMSNSGRFGHTGNTSFTPPGSGRGTPTRGGGPGSSSDLLPPPGSRGTSPRSNSLHTLNQSLNQQVKNGAGRHPKPPPPPNRQPSPVHSQGSQPPPPPADGRPSFSRPSSAASGNSAARRAAAAKLPPA